MTSLLYKFLPTDIALKVLEEKRLKVSLLTELNDIFDCYPVIDTPQRERGHASEFLERFLGTWNEKAFGLLCLSRTYRSPLLWGHYAAGATGLALGFDLEGISLGMGETHVKYEADRPHISTSTPGNATHGQWVSLMKRWFSTKAREWQYEEEVRYLLQLDTCTPRSGMYFVDYPAHTLKQVIIGYRSSVSTDYLRRFLKSSFPGPVDVKVGKPHATRFEIEIDGDFHSA